MNPQGKQELFEKIFKEHLKVETFSKSIDSLFSPRSKNKIDYKPYYQRNYVWDDHKATYFIESILLGTEIPPLIFFNNNSGIEVIDGRQRYETIMRFMENAFSLSERGLSMLNQLKGTSWEKLCKNHSDIVDDFLDTKLRIIEFRLVNKPPLDLILQDQVKKEIFSRYNSGITPLKKAEIDNAIYDDDDLTNFFKERLFEDEAFKAKVFKNFFKQPKVFPETLPTEKILSFTRRSLVLPMYPINYFVGGSRRTNTLAKLYEYFADKNIDNHQLVFASFRRRVDFISSIRDFSEKNDLSINRLALECFMWGLGVLELEGIAFDYENSIESIARYIDEHIDYYTLLDYNFSTQIMARFLATSEYFEDHANADFSAYITANQKAKELIKEFQKPKESTTELDELESLRLSKPEPSNNSVDDIIRVMTRRRFMLRPSYQRQEVINVNKASSIIESVLLGIKLPPIFVYKRKDGTNEVIDGQQRLLTLLGFLGEDYLNEHGELIRSKNHKFGLKKLRILKELKGLKFEELTEDLKDKIYDFQIYVVEIDEQQNPKFDPIDLFIRLNDKPYPIRENSFEMWNSWADVEVIRELKTLKTKVENWFFLKKIKRATDRDRMENEELLTSLCYIEFYSSSDAIKTIDVYQKATRMNSRISTKARISSVMQSITESDEAKTNFFTSIKQVKSNIKKIKYILIDRDVTKEELSSFLKSELDALFNGGELEKGYRRRIQDFYFLWLLVGKLNFAMVKYHRLQMKKEIQDIFKFIKNLPDEYQEANKGLDKYNELVQNFHAKYERDKRKTRLTEEQKLALIKEQGNESSLSDAPIFLGDDLEVDHIEPLALGGKDEIANLGIAHQEENRQKGVNKPPR